MKSINGISLVLGTLIFSKCFFFNLRYMGVKEECIFFSFDTGICFSSLNGEVQTCYVGDDNGFSEIYRCATGVNKPVNFCIVKLETLHFFLFCESLAK